jgi:DNA-binding NtrC family response regulator
MTNELQKAVLVIEDDMSVAAYMKGVVETFFPVTVLHAASAESARTLFHENHGSIAAVISDLSLPGIQGVSLVKELVAARGEIGIVFVTGHVEVEQHLSKAVGRKIALVMKPFGPMELKAVLEKHLATSATAYELTR